MKTLFCFDSFGQSDVCFFELEGNYSHLNEVYINSAETSRDKEKELMDLLYDEHGDYRIKKLKQPTKDWNYFCIVGFIP